MTTPPGDSIVRRLGPSDADHLVRWCSQHKTRAPTVDQAVSFLAAEEHCLLMAFERDAPVGMLYGFVLDRIDGQRMALIYELEVVDRHRRRGHGQRLLRAALEVFESEAVLAVWLTTGRDNEPARQLYRSAKAQEIDDVLYQWSFGR